MSTKKYIHRVAEFAAKVRMSPETIRRMDNDDSFASNNVVYYMNNSIHDPRPSGDYACGEDVSRVCSSTASVLCSEKQEPIIVPA